MPNDSYFSEQEFEEAYQRYANAKPYVHGKRKCPTKQDIFNWLVEDEISEQSCAKIKTALIASGDLEDDSSPAVSKACHLFRDAN